MSVPRPTTLFESVLYPFKKIATYFSGVNGIIPPGTGYVLLVLLVVAVVATAIGMATKQPDVKSTENLQLQAFRPAYGSIALTRKGVGDYLTVPAVQASNTNWVLLNFAPLTCWNAGYVGPYMNGVYSTDALRLSLDLGFRCFVFHIDHYTGNPKTGFPAPKTPCLLHRDSMGVLRSVNAGDIGAMMRALDEQAFSPSLHTGSDPLIVILDFKNTPDPVNNPTEYKTFLTTVSKAIQPLRRTLLTKLGESQFNGLANQNLLFTQNFQSLQKKTLIFTNANTDCFLNATDGSKPEENLRSMIHAQVYSTSGGVIPNDKVTQAAPSGTQLAVGRQTDIYFLQSPADRVNDMTAKTNNVYTYSDISQSSSNKYINISTQDQGTLLTKFGVQMVPYNVFSTPEETSKMLDTWGAYSWKLKPPTLQYIVQRTVPPAQLSRKADAAGGNVSPPPLNL